MRFIKLMVIGLMVMIVAFLTMAARPTVTAADENGKDLYKVDCKTCHLKDSPNGEYTPMSLTQDQWKAFFDKKLEKTHKDVIFEPAKKKLLEHLTPAQIGMIKKFCVDHAADSEQPQTCS